MTASSPAESASASPDRHDAAVDAMADPRAGNAPDDGPVFAPVAAAGEGAAASNSVAAEGAAGSVPAGHPVLAVGPLFIATIAAIMAINALATDIMLPALGQIGDDLGIAHANDRQWIISAFMLGFGSTQLIYGPLADRYGRRPVLNITVIAFAIASFLAVAAQSFAGIVAARFLMGMFSASSRILAVSIVRDTVSGRQMARVMSLAFMVFLLVPMIAPTLGSVILAHAGWHAIFVLLGVYALALAGWAAFWLPETLHPEYRRPIQLAVIAAGIRETVRVRQSIGYTLAMALLFGALLGFISSAQQLFSTVFHADGMFGLIFAFIATGMAIAAFTNSRIVERVGVHRVSHTALAGFCLITGVHLIVALAGRDTLWTFAIFQFFTMACFGLAGSNFGSLAMEPMAALAGTAASVQGTISTLIGTAMAIIVGQQFNGSTVPIVGGFFALGCLSLLMVLWTERGKLWGVTRQPPA